MWCMKYYSIATIARILYRARECMRVKKGRHAIIKANKILVSLWTWHKPTEKFMISGICLNISSVTKWTPRCWGLRLILRWNQAEPIWRVPIPAALPPPPRWLVDEAIPLSCNNCGWHLKTAANPLQLG